MLFVTVTYKIITTIQLSHMHNFSHHTALISLLLPYLDHLYHPITSHKGCQINALINMLTAEELIAISKINATKNFNTGAITAIVKSQSTHFLHSSPFYQTLQNPNA